MGHSIKDIASALGLTAEGETDLVVTGVAEPASAAPDQLALAMRPEYAATLASGAARAAMLWADADWRSYGLRTAILARRPRFAMAGLSALMDPGQGYETGIHPTAIVAPDAVLGQDVAVGPFSIVASGARIGTGSVIGPQCHVGRDATLGAGAFLHVGVRIGARVTIGARFVAQPGAVIGADGFSFVTPEVSGVERARETLGAAGGDLPQHWARIHSLGAVSIGDDVEVGANTCIDRGSVRDTRIGDGCKFDNLVQIGHNVVIGRDCLICAQVGVAGSTAIGDNVVLGGQTGVSDNIHIGNNVITGGGTKVLSSVPAGRVMLGYPAVRMEAHIESYKALRRLPRVLAALQKAVSKPQRSD